MTFFRAFVILSVCVFRLSFASDVTELSASLLFHVNEQIDEWNGDSAISIPFTAEEEIDLWDKLRAASHQDYCVERAYVLFEEAMQMPEGQGIDELKECSLELTAFWKSTDPDHNVYVDSVEHYQFSKSHLMTQEARDLIAPYALPRKHKLSDALDEIFTKSRATKNMETFKKAGFDVLHVQPRSFILVARHEKLPGHLLKVYLDDEERLKKNIPGWRWFVYRCQGAEKIAKIIEKRKIKHFTVPKKYIYVLPEKPSAPHGGGYKPKIALLVVEDMNIVDNDENNHRWKHNITEEHLRELYAIISRANGSSYRAGNIPWTKAGKIAFVDTEYPYHSPDYKSIRSYLSHEMCDRWDSIVKHKGKR